MICTLKTWLVILSTAFLLINPVLLATISLAEHDDVRPALLVEHTEYADYSGPMETPVSKHCELHCQAQLFLQPLLIMDFQRGVRRSSVLALLHHHYQRSPIPPLLPPPIG